MSPVFPENGLYLHEIFGVLGIRGPKLLLKDFQSVSWDQDEGIAQNLGTPAGVTCVAVPCDAAVPQPHLGARLCSG